MKRTLTSWLLAISILTGFSSCSTLRQLGLVPSEFEMAAGLRDALEQGLFRSFDAFADPRGNALLRFALPGEAAQIEKALNDLGLGSLLDNVTGKFTRAMSSAVLAAKPIFINSIKQMTIRDAVNILVTDNPHAATEYFKRVNKPMLMDAFRPIVDSTIRVERADADWGRIATVYNALPFRKEPLETNMTDFVAARAIDGMALIMANEEEQIRNKYEFRKTDMMRKAFGYAEQELKRRSATRSMGF